MIEEIVKFIGDFKREYNTVDNLSGLYITIEMDKEGYPIENSYKSYIITEETIVGINDAVLNDLKERERYSKCIDMNKVFDTGTGGRKIHSVNAFSIWFKKKSILLLKDRLDNYFETAKRYAEESVKSKIDLIKKFSKEILIEKIKTDPNLAEIKDDIYIKVYFKVGIELLKQSFKKYLDNHLFFNEDKDINVILHSNEKVGPIGLFNTFNNKKPFLKHLTTNFKINSRNSLIDHKCIFRFEQLLRENKIPNPLPIFVDESKLNEEVLRLYNEEKVLKFREIIDKLIKEHKKDLFNYYLVYWLNSGEDIVIQDIDYVPHFKYKLSGFEISNIMGIKNYEEIKIDNIFQFELEIVWRLFNNALIVKAKNEKILFKYFEDIDPKYVSHITYHNILKYRKSFYNYIYKSQTQAITGKMFYDLVLSTIMDDIRQDDNFKSSDKIKEKLNIFFSLNHIFDKNNNNFKGVDMSSKIPEYQEQMRKLFKGENYHISSDDEFAFAAGQLIYYILKQSKSSNKSHALLEPYISKTNPEQFRQMIIRGINQYKHAFEWYGNGKGRFEKLVSEILGYDCKTNIKSLLPMILAGYFSESLIYEKSDSSL